MTVPPPTTARLRDQRTPVRSAQRRGFTLIELMISVSVLLVIMAGIATVFRSVGDTLRTGLTNSAGLRANLDISRQLRTDLEGVHPDGFLVIVSQKYRAFRDPFDRDLNQDDPNFGLTNGARDAYDPSTGWNKAFEGQGKRWWRGDILSFWAIGQFPDRMGAQAPGNGPILYEYPGLATSEAWVTWAPAEVDVGADLFNNITGAEGSDGAPDSVNLTNNWYKIGRWKPNNLANEVILSRRAILAPGVMTALFYSEEDNPALPFPVPAMDLYQNLAIANSALRFADSPFAGAVVNHPAENLSQWSLDAIYDGHLQDRSTSATESGQMSTFTINGFGRPFAFSNVPSGASRAFNVTQIKRAMDLAQRPRVSVNLDTLPPTREDMAKTRSVVTSGVSDFIVEFAGDYLNQTRTPDAWYNPDKWELGQDGLVDFIPLFDIDPNDPDNTRRANASKPMPWNVLRGPINSELQTTVRKLRRYTIWYGAFRDGNNSGTTFARSDQISTDEQVRRFHRSDLAYDVAPVYSRAFRPGALFFIGHEQEDEWVNANPENLPEPQTVKGLWAPNPWNVPVSDSTRDGIPFYFENCTATAFGSNPATGFSRGVMQVQGMTRSNGESVVGDRGGYTAIDISSRTQLYKGWWGGTDASATGSILDSDNGQTPTGGSQRDQVTNVSLAVSGIGANPTLPQDSGSGIARQVPFYGEGIDTPVSGPDVRRRYSPGIGNVGNPSVPDDPMTVNYQAAFIRDFGPFWPRLLRITYRVHSGSEVNDEGLLVTEIIPMPATN